MKIWELNKYNIIFSDSNETYHFSKINEIGWVLKQLRFIYNNQEMEINAYFNENGTYNTITIDYYINDIIRRKLEFDDAGNIKEDKIYVFNPTNGFIGKEFHKVNCPNITFNEYLNNNDEEFKYLSVALNNKTLLPNEILYRFLNRNNLFSHFFNILDDDLDKIREVLENDEYKEHIKVRKK